MSIFKAAFERMKEERDPAGPELALRQDAERVAEALSEDLRQLKVEEVGVEQDGSSVLVSDGSNLLVVRALGGAMYALAEYQVPPVGVPMGFRPDIQHVTKGYKQDEMAHEVIRWIGIERLEQLNGGQAGARK